MIRTQLIFAFIIISLSTYAAEKGNWPQWRGPNGDGTTLAEKAPTTWSETKNLKWKLKLPGFGASSPIVWNEHIYLTCYTGYGAGSRGGSPANMMRHLVCVDAYSSYQDSYGTPSLVKAKGGLELVLAVPGEIWSFDAKEGNITWYAYTNVGGRGGNVSPSAITGGGALYAFGGRPGSGVAIKLGQKGEVKESAQLWTSRISPYVATPVYHEGHLYWMDRSGYAICLNAKTGREAYKERLKSSSRTPQFYASPVVVDGKIISVSRNAGAFVLEAKPKFKQLAQNTFASDRSVFNASPAISNGRLYLRSDTHLYCVSGQ